MRRARGTAVIGALACAVSLLSPAPVVASAQAVAPSSTQKFGLDDLDLVGVAERRPTGWIRLTGTDKPYAVGAAYPPEPTTVDRIVARVRFRIHGDCADGLAIVIQDDGPVAIGGYGEDLGYGRNSDIGTAGVTHSIAIEADLYSNSSGDEPIPSVGLQTRGVRQNDGDPAYALKSRGADDLLADEVHRMGVTYRAGRMRVFLDGDRRLRKNVDLVDLLGLDDGTAYVGLSSGTGLCVPTISIRGFTVSD